MAQPIAKDNQELTKRELFETTWKLVNKYLKDNRGYQLVKHLLDSYNDFVARKIDNVLEGFNPIEIHHQFIPELQQFKYSVSIEVKNPIMSKPTIYEKDGSTKVMTPTDARNRNFTYAAPLFVELHIKTRTLDTDTGEVVEEVKKISNVSLGKIPVMVGSRYCVLSSCPSMHTDECKYDYGGYFVINGNEKVVISQDRIAENKPFVFNSNKVSTYSHLTEIRSVVENKFGVPKTTCLKLSSKPNQFGRYIRVNVHHIKHDIPLFILYRALGIVSDKEIMQYIVRSGDDNFGIISPELVGSMEEANNVTCMREAREYLCRFMNVNGHPKELMMSKPYRMQVLAGILEKEFLPHVGQDLDKKAMYLGYMTHKLLSCYLHIIPFDDRDSYINKRVDTPGILMANLFRQYYSKVVKDMRNMIQKDINSGTWKATNKFSNVINKVNINKIVKSTIIESGLKFGLATGNWGIKTGKTKQGVAQVLNRMTYTAMLSHLRRINTPIEKTGKLVQPRKLHATQWGIICPAECFDPNTPILTWEGIIKKAKDINVGDNLIDDMGNAVRVKSTCAGFKRMYEVVPEKSNTMRHTVTDNHILTLKVKNANNVRNHRGMMELSWFDKEKLMYNYRDFESEDELVAFRSALDVKDVTTIDITIETYLSLPDNVRKNLYIFKSEGINWERKDVTLDPYILGMWLGDGLSHGYGFATADQKLLDKWVEWGAANDATIKKGHGKYKYGISSIHNTQPGNKPARAPLKKLLAKYELVNNKHIPLDYLVNDRATRLALLAGLIDTDGSVRKGHEIRICQGKPNYRIIHDAEFLARSLGFSCHMNDGTCSYTVHGEKRQRPYKELTITGYNLYEIPTVLSRKKLVKFDNPVMEKRSRSNLMSSFKLVPRDVQPFVGWQVEGNGRFLLGDMSTTHNTPEGVSVGLVKNMSVVCSITTASNSSNLREILVSPEMGLNIYANGNMDLFNTGSKVFVNGDLIGVHTKPQDLYARLKAMKRKGVINVFTSVYWSVSRNEIWICTEGGRCVRPVFVVRDNKIGLTKDMMTGINAKELGWTDMVSGSVGTEVDDAVIEYLDVEECNNSMIAMRAADLDKGMKGSSYPVKYSHLEIDPSMIMGAIAGSIPFANHNQAPRVAYQCAMAKQAVGTYASNYRKRFDTLGHILNYPQKPLVQTRMSKIIHGDKLPAGMNAIVAIATWTGFNQEDSVILNKSAVERGMFGSTYYRTYKDQNIKNHSTGEEEYYCKPDLATTRSVKPYNYEKLGVDGFVPENTMIEAGDVIIGKCMPQKQGSIIANKDSSVALKNNEIGFVDKNACNDNTFTNVNGDGYTFTKVRVRSDRVPTIGDKFSTRHAQKGTVGMMYPQADMPFSSGGIVPDIIINPHAIPSRMTIGQLMECVMGKACASLGSMGDGTPFTDLSMEDIAKALDMCGMERYGNEVMYNSRTGEMMGCDIFMGPTYYQRLKHMVADKVHSRNGAGPIVMLTRQPAEGRAREGGLRLGEMEVECNWAHGTMQFLKERTMDNSDNYRVFVCKKCGIMANVNPEKGLYHCAPCSNTTHFAEVRIPYACKLLFQEVQTLGIGTRILTK